MGSGIAQVCTPYSVHRNLYYLLEVIGPILIKKLLSKLNVNPFPSHVPFGN